jgi:hypothetical protein
VTSSSVIVEYFAGFCLPAAAFGTTIIMQTAIVIRLNIALFIIPSLPCLWTDIRPHGIYPYWSISKFYLNATPRAERGL